MFRKGNTVLKIIIQFFVVLETLQQKVTNGNSTRHSAKLKCQIITWKFYEKGILKNFAKFLEKHLCRGLFLIKSQVSSLQIYQLRDCYAGAF